MLSSVCLPAPPIEQTLRDGFRHIGRALQYLALCIVGVSPGGNCSLDGFGVRQ